MKRATVAALLLWTSVLIILPRPVIGKVGADSKSPREHEQETDDESDSAPFMIVVEHGNGRRCGGSLVSLRTALTSAWCVRGPHGGNPRELWALSPGVPAIPTASRRVSRVALVAGADADSPSPHLHPGWIGAALDIAVLELEAPFGGGARSRPILMATRPEDCAIDTLCHVVRVRGRSPRLRIVDATLVPGEACGAVAAGWPALRDSALCLTGPTLCSMDRGAGVVCDGKLCGVLSRSARATAVTTPQNISLDTESTTSAAEARDATCGDTHVALSVAKMRRFLHCAHTLRACGHGGECSQQCSERQLMVLEARDTEPINTESEGGTEQANEPTTTSEATTESRQADGTSVTKSSTTVAEYVPMFKTSPKPSPSRTAAPVTLAKAVAMPVSMSRPTFEFEPNRADFRGAPARTSRVYLKAGEYGDNALDYGDAEESGMGGGPPGAASVTSDASVSSVAAAFSSPTDMPENYSPGTTTPKHSGPTHTEMPDNDNMITNLKTITPRSVGEKLSHVRVSKLDAQHVATDDEKIKKAELRNYATNRQVQCTLMSFVVLLQIYNVL